jgi:hypothetical protein
MPEVQGFLPPPRSIGHRTTCSTALISRRVVKACSISSRAFRLRSSMSQERSWPNGDVVIVHGRFSGFGRPVNWIAADILRIKDGVLIEHWDVIQDEATRESSKSGRPMFGDGFEE